MNQRDSEAIFLNSLEQQLAGRQKLLVAFSGGLDSTVLLHQLILLRRKRSDLQIRALHVNHGLSAHADHWATHCFAFCEHWNVPFTVVKIQVKRRGQGLEAAARDGRYETFLKHLQSQETLVTAHHKDDQCETVLLALKRGSGPAGLAAMPSKLSLGKYTLLRPLLSFRRETLEAWARDHELHWIDDESNQDVAYDRNFIRQKILPLLHARWPHFSDSVVRSALLCGEQEQLLDECLSDLLDKLVLPDGSMVVQSFSEMSDVCRSALLRRWISKQHGKMPSHRVIQCLCKEVIFARDDATPCLRLDNKEIRRYRERLYLIPFLPPIPDNKFLWDRPWAPLCLPGNLGKLSLDPNGTKLRPPESHERVNVRFHLQGKVRLAGRQGQRSVKKIWQEYAVPPWKRDRTPLIFYNDTFIAAPGLFVSQEGAADPTSGMKILWSDQAI